MPDATLALHLVMEPASPTSDLRSDDRAPPLPSGRVIAVALGLTALLAAYDAFLVTHFTLHFGLKPPHWRLYWSMWQSLLQGRLDLDPVAAEGEAFHHDGKTFSAYGIFPATLRALSTLFGVPPNSVALISCVLAALLCAVSFLWAGVLLGLSQRGIARRFWTLALVAALASPVLVGLGQADIYNEAVLWGTAWVSVFIAALIVRSESPPGSRVARASLVVMGAASGLALLSRTTSGLCAIAAFAWYLAGSAHRFREPAARWSVLACLVLCGVQAEINIGRFGSPFAFRPMQWHEAFEGTERGDLDRLHGEVNLGRVPTSACFYFGVEPSNFEGHWPFVRPGGDLCFKPDLLHTLEAHGWQARGVDLPRDAGPYYDLIDGPRLPLTVMTPVLFVLAGAGLIRVRRERVPRRQRAAAVILIAGVLTLGLLLTFDTLAERYGIELAPMLLGFAFLGLLPSPASNAAPPRKPNDLRSLFFVLLVAFSILSTHVALLRIKATKNGVPRQMGLALRQLLGE